MELQPVKGRRPGYPEYSEACPEFRDDPERQQRLQYPVPQGEADSNRQPVLRTLPGR